MYNYIKMLTGCTKVDACKIKFTECGLKSLPVVVSLRHPH